MQELFNKSILNDVHLSSYENLDLVNKGDFLTLKSNIPDVDYYENFVANSKELAPDGDDINLVGLSIVRDSIKKDIALTKPRKEIITIKSLPNIGELNDANSNNENIELIGSLSFADVENDKIKLTTEDKRKHNIIISDGLIEIVKKYFGEKVIVKVKTVNNSIKLSEIDPYK